MTLLRPYQSAGATNQPSARATRCRAANGLVTASNRADGTGIYSAVPMASAPHAVGDIFDNLDAIYFALSDHGDGEANEGGSG